jgi:adenylate cyclase
MTSKAPGLATLRLASGVILFVYVTTHLLNHALGLISLDAMETGRHAFLALWRNPLGKTLLYGSVVVHAALALWALFNRRTLRRITAADAVQAVFGLAIMPLLAQHVIATGLANSVWGLQDRYAYVLLSLWWFAPAQGLMQSAALVVVWTHGCIGIHQWLRLRVWYRHAVGTLYTLAVMIPVLALLGMADGARDAIRSLADMNWVDRYNAEVVITPEIVAWAERMSRMVMTGLAALAAALLAARLLLGLYERRFQRVSLVYPSGKTVQIRPGAMTVLEASRLGGIPHASVCGGRGRCSTCRVRLGPGAEAVAPPSDDEHRVLKRVAAAPGVRLACQIRPTGNLSVTPLLPANAGPRAGYERPDFVQGSEREIAILFADIRQFTRFSETRLPYDVVFVVNQFSRQMGSAVHQAGGRIDKFIGDGIMALFGIEGGPEAGSRQAIAAARAMAANLDALNQSLHHDLDDVLRIGIGIHCGAAIVGEMGYADAITVTAIGDAVNIAARLETATKDYGAQLVMSRAVAEKAGLDTSGLRHEMIEVRGRDERVEAIIVDDARRLPET